MRVARTKAIIPVACVVGLFLVTGCTDYKKKFDNLNVEHQNLQGRYENMEKSNQDLSARISQDQETINNLQKQIEESKKPAGDVLGLEGLQVDVNAQAGTLTVTLENALLFDSGKATLKNATVKDLDRVISVVKQKFPGREIDVIGNTDTDPINKTKDQWKDNWDLSAQRSLAVLRYMVEHGIPDSQIRGVACGSGQPVAPNTTVANKAKNRRVEIVVHVVRQSKTAPQNQTPKQPA
jgi:chemotaxis protein MotB